MNGLTKLQAMRLCDLVNREADRFLASFGPLSDADYDSIRDSAVSADVPELMYEITAMDDVETPSLIGAAFVFDPTFEFDARLALAADRRERRITTPARDRVLRERVRRLAADLGSTVEQLLEDLPVLAN